MIALGLALFHIYVAAFGTPEGRSFRSVHLTGMLILAFFTFPLFRKSVARPLVLVDGSPGQWIAAYWGLPSIWRSSG